ncbi:MAG: dephospho-CoA kinase [Phycisphaeraceae bacterium]|nr:dephospho-CoA kinase [Phycisphaeraceae bacterium]
MTDKENIAQPSIPLGMVPAGEVVLWASRPAFRWIIRAAIRPLVIFVSIWLAAWSLRGWIALWPDRLMAIALVSIIVVLLWLICVRQSRLYFLSNRRLVVRFGVFVRGIVDIPLDRIQHVIVKADPFDRLLGIGSLGMASAAGGLDAAWIGVARPHRVYRNLQDVLAKNGVLTSSPVVHEQAVSTVQNKPDVVETHRPILVGLTGGIGAGKSTVAEEFVRLGAVVIDSDAISRRAMQRDDVKKTLREWWGGKVFNDKGEVDRSALAAIVFADKSERARLESLIHPLIQHEREAVIRQASQQGCRMVVLDAPLLFEVGLEKTCELTVFVDAPRALRLERLASARGWTDNELTRRESAQWPSDQKRQASTVVLDNSGDELALKAAVRTLYHDILKQPRSRSGAIQDPPVADRA